MLRKLTVISLIVGLCLMGAIPGLAQKVYPTLAEYEKLTGKEIEAFNEAPMLKVKVAAGELLPLEERLPEEPMVVKPLEEIGRYGGALRGAARAPTSGRAPTATPRQQTLFDLSPDLKTVVPNIAKGWDLSEDTKTLTVYLRKGMRWSDGAPFTADDIIFWYEDIILNDELTPVKPKRWSPGGELVKIEKMDDYTVRFQFTAPYPPIVNILARGNDPFSPKHYLKEYHIKYNPRANELAKKEGYDYWWQCFNYYNTYGWGQIEADLPTLDPWLLKKMDTVGNKYFERNPYYWKIDTSGNQLPYIDKQDALTLGNIEIIQLKAIAGELSYAGIDLSLENYPLYKEGEKKGNYHVILAEEPCGTNLLYAFNLTHKDPVLRKIFNDIRFRQAMSLSINRKEINEVLYFGKAVPRQATTDPDCSFYEDWMGKYYAEYDPARADRLLDEMGLKWDKKHQYRLRSDGKPIAITIDYVQMQGPRGKGCELVKEYWEKVGIKVATKEYQRSFFQQRGKANEHDVANWKLDNATEFHARVNSCVRYRPPFAGAGNPFSCVEWWNWYNTDGRTGEEPPEVIKRLYNLTDEWLITPSGTDEYMKLGKEILTINLENLFLIGTVGMAPKAVIMKNDLRNAPRKLKFISDYGFWKPYHADQWFFER